MTEADRLDIGLRQLRAVVERKVAARESGRDAASWPGMADDPVPPVLKEPSGEAFPSLVARTAAERPAQPTAEQPAETVSSTPADERHVAQESFGAREPEMPQQRRGLLARFLGYLRS